MNRQRALDGLRGVALVGMLAWHAEVTFVRGGFARMTIFFALSGYLATRSYLRLVDRRGGRGWGSAARSFYARRARRLLPVTVLGLAASVAVTIAVGTTDMRAALTGDALASATSLSNWRFIAADRSYGALFERPSAFQHLWSLSLEEQCLLVLPLLLALVVGRTPEAARRRWAPAVTAALAAALAAVPAFVEHTPDAAYYGTHVRAAEVLAGVTLALVLHRWGGTVPERWHRPVQVVGTIALAGLAVVMVAVDRELPWLYRGGLGLFALPAVAVIAAAGAERGPVPRVLGVRPLAAMGRAAFPIYVLHWPLFVVVRHRIGPAPGPVVVLAELAAGIALGLVVHHAIERPLLPGATAAVTGAARRLALTDRRVIGTAAAGLAAVVLVTVAVPAPEPVYDFAEAERRANTAVPVAIDDNRPGIALFGGSTSVSLGAVAASWAEGAAAPVRMAGGSTQAGCGLVTEGRRLAGGSATNAAALHPPNDYCYGWEERWRQVADEHAVSVAVLIGGVWETTDWLLDGHEVPTDITHPEFAALVRAKLQQATALFTETGRRVLLATTPDIGPGESGQVPVERGLRPDHRRRIDTYNELVREVAAGNDHVDVLEYGELIDALDPELSVQWLPDGVHPTEPAALTIWSELIGPAVVAAAQVTAEAQLASVGTATGMSA